MKKYILKKDDKVVGTFDTKNEAQTYVINKTDEGEDVFGYTISEEEVLDICSRVKTYADACRIIGVEPINEEEFKAKGFRDDEIARRKLETITAALNDGWKPNFNDTVEYKYFPYFFIEPSKSYSAHAKLSSAFTYYSTTETTAGIGSRLCFNTAAKARHAGNTFTELYATILIENYNL